MKNRRLKFNNLIIIIIIINIIIITNPRFPTHRVFKSLHVVRNLDETIKALTPFDILHYNLKLHFRLQVTKP